MDAWNHKCDFTEKSVSKRLKMMQGDHANPEKVGKKYCKTWPCTNRNLLGTFWMASMHQMKRYVANTIVDWKCTNTTCGLSLILNKEVSAMLHLLCWESWCEKWLQQGKTKRFFVFFLNQSKWGRGGGFTGPYRKSECRGDDDTCQGWK